MFKYFVKSKEIFLKFKSVSFSFKGLAIAVSAGGLIVIFQNCAGGFDINQEALSSLSSTGLDFCRQNPEAPECVDGAEAECNFNGHSLADGQTVRAYLNSTVPSGQSCESEVRQCQSGVLSGSYNYASCGVNQAASCLFNGQTIASGQSVTAFLASSASGACTQETRVCNNGALSGSYTFATCSLVVPAPTLTSENQDVSSKSATKTSTKTCALGGITLASGSQITAYAQATANAGEACVAEIRSCNNGVLSGSYTNTACTQPTTSCSFNGQTVAHGTSVVAYPKSTVATGSKCEPTTRTCFNGVLSGTANYASCSVNQPASCLFNDNQTVAHGQSVTAYASANPAVGVACSSQVRTCNNGTLSGSNAFPTCTATMNPQSAPKTCTLNGVVVQSGGSITAYSSETASEGGLCLQQTRVCNDGVLSGTYEKTSCTVPKNTCSFNGKTVEHGSSVEAYPTSTVSAGNLCTPVTRTCNNGILSESGDYASCSVDKPASCLFNTRTAPQTVPHGQSVTAYSSASGNCSSETRICDNGVLSGSYIYSACTQAKASCDFGGQTVAHGKSITAYESSAVSYGKKCTAIKRTCYNGSLSGSGDYKSCVADKPASCLFNTQTVAHGQSVISYAASSVPYGQSCKSLTRTCSNGVLSGSGDYSSCAVGQAASCLVGTQTIPHGGSANFYSSEQGTAAQACKSEKRTCINGILSGSATATSCTEFTAGSCSPVKCDKWISQADPVSWNLRSVWPAPSNTDDSSKFVGSRYCVSQDLDFGSKKASGRYLTSLDAVAINGCGFKWNNINTEAEGLFIGNGILFENLTLNAPKVNSSMGKFNGILFGNLSNSTVRNVKIENMVSASIKGNWSGISCGGVIGYAKDVTLNDISISGDVLSLSGCQYIGGVVGYLENSSQFHPRTIKNISVKFEEMDFDKFSMAGGFAGYLKDDSEGLSNINVAGDMFFGDGLNCQYRNSNSSSPMINCNSAGGIIGQLFDINLTPYSLIGLNYTGRIYSWGLGYSGGYQAGTGGLIGSLYNSNTLKLSLVDSSVTGQVNVMGSPTNMDPANLFGGSVVGGNFVSTPISIKNLNLNVTLKVNGEVSNKTVGVDPDSKAGSCQINGESIAANTTVKRFLTSAVGENQPADAAVYFQCKIEAVNVHNLSAKKSLNIIANNANINFSKFSSSGYSVDAEVSWLKHSSINVSTSFDSAFRKASNNRQLSSFAGWLYANSTADTSDRLQHLSSINNPTSNWVAPDSNVSSFIERHPTATQDSFSTVVQLPTPPAPTGSTGSAGGTGSNPTTPTTPAPILPAILSQPRQYSADGYLWTESYPEGKWAAVSISSDKKSIVISNPYYSNPANNFYITTDSGKTWTPTVSSTPKNLFDSSSNDGKVILRMKEIVISSRLRKVISLSKDSGKTWKDLTPPSKTYIAGGVTGSGSKIYLSSADGYVLSSIDDGITWKTFQVIVDPNKPNNSSNVRDATNSYNSNFIGSGHLITFNDDNRLLHVTRLGSFVSPDGGVTWYRNLGELQFYPKLFVSKNKKTIITETYSYPAQIVISTDSGQSFRGISTESLRSASISDDGSKIVLMTASNLYLSTDGGSSFKKLNEKYLGSSFNEFAASPDTNTIAVVQDNRVIIGVKSTEQVAYTLSGYDFAIKNAFPFSPISVSTIAMSYDGTKMMATLDDSLSARNPDNNNVRYYGPGTMSSGNKGVSWSPIGSNSCVNNSYIDMRGVRQWNPCTVTYSTYGSYIEMSYDGSKAISIIDTSTFAGPGRGLGGGVSFPVRDSDSSPILVGTMAMSSDAKKIIAFATNGIYTTTDGGVKWTKRVNTVVGSAAAMSADGDLIVAVNSQNGKFWKSTDGGVKWIEIKSPALGSYSYTDKPYISIAKSEDQYILTANANGGKIYQSKDSGATWKLLNVPGVVDTFSTSADGKVIAVGMRDSYVYLSKDGGVTFTEQTKAGRHKWSAIKVSPDGKMLAVGSSAPNANLQVADISAVTPGATSIPAVPVAPQPAPAPATPQPQSCESVSPTCASGLAVWDGSSCACTTPENTAPTYTESYN